MMGWFPTAYSHTMGPRSGFGKGGKHVPGHGGRCCVCLGVTDKGTCRAIFNLSPELAPLGAFLDKGLRRSSYTCPHCRPCFVLNPFRGSRMGKPWHSADYTFSKS
jgi:hypothetical protein